MAFRHSTTAFFIASKFIANILVRLHKKGATAMNKSHILISVALSVLITDVSSQAATSTPSFGVSFNDSVYYYSGLNYNAGDRIIEHKVGVYGNPYVIEGSAHAAFGTLGISTFLLTGVNTSPQPYIAELVKSYSYDIFDINSNTLAVGTPVTVTFTAMIKIDALAPAPYPLTSVYPAFPSGVVDLNHLGAGLAAGISFDFNDIFDPSTCSQFVGTGCNGPVLGSGVNIISFDRHVHVGDVVPLRTRFEAVAFQYRPYYPTGGDAGSAFFAQSGARTFIHTSSSQVFVSARSGFDYSGTAVPEPATWLMMLVGFGCTAVAIRHHKAKSIAG